MLITDKFVMLALPKTGSSFVRKNLKRIHNYNSLTNKVLRKLSLPTRSTLTELILPVIDQKHPPVPSSRHVTYVQIPLEYSARPVISTIRNPFDRYVSLYFFPQWRETFRRYLQIEGKSYPKFPELEFEEYYEFIHLFGRENRLMGLQPQIDLGVYTIQFIQFFFRDPEATLTSIDDEYLQNRKYKGDMAPITFLRQERLNQDLYELLRAMRYPEDKIQFLLTAERVNTSRRLGRDKDPRNFYTQDMIDLVLRRERLIFDIFPHFAEGWR